MAIDERTPRQKLLSESITDYPQQYRGVVREAYQQMTPGQAGEVEFLNQANAGQVANMTTSLAQNFIDRYMQKNNGQLPTAAIVSDFVAKNMNTSVAKRMLTGQISNEQIRAELADPFLNTIQAPETDIKTIGTEDAGLAKRLDDLYKQALGYGERRIDERYVPMRTRAVDEEAALGRWGSPVSIPKISKIDEAREREKSDLYGQMAGARMGEEFGLSKALADISSRENLAGKQLGLQKWQTGLSSDLANRTLSEQLNQYNQELGLRRQEMGAAEKLMSRLGGKKERDWADWTQLGMQAAETGYKIFGPK